MNMMVSRRRPRRFLGCFLLAIAPSLHGAAVSTEPLPVVCGGSYDNTTVMLRHHLLCFDCSSKEPVVRLHSNTHLDLNGYKLKCHRGWTTMISVEGDFNTVRNGVIDTSPSFPEKHDGGWGSEFAVEVQGSHNAIELLHLETQRLSRCTNCNRPSGIRITDGANNTVQAVSMQSQPTIGIELRGGSNHVIQEVMIQESHTYGILVHAGTNHTIVDNHLHLLLGSGILVNDSVGTAINNVTLSLSSGSVRIVGGYRNEVMDCDIDSRGTVPISLESNGSGHSVTGNTVSGKAPYAILIGEEVTNCTVSGNTASREFYSFKPGGSVFYNTEDDCDLISNTWVNNNGGSFECGSSADSIPLSNRYAAMIFNYLPTPQYSVLAGILMLTTFLSTIGSGTVISLIIRKNRNEVTVMHRMLLGLTFADFISSLSGFLQPTLLPADTLMPLAVGNIASCRFVGFGAYFFLASTIYFCELALYFYLTIRHGWSEKRAAEQLEPGVHLLPWTTVLAHNTVGLAMDLFQPNAVLGLCLIGCKQDYGTDQCIEGINPTVAKFMQIPTSLIPPLCAVLGTTWTVGVFNTVREQERKMSRYTFGNPTRFQEDEARTPRRSSSLPLGSTAFLEAQVDSVRRRMSSIPGSLALLHMNHKKTKAVAMQALCYCAAYLNSFVGALVWTITRLVYELNREMRLSVSNNSTGLYVALLVVFSVHPLLGFLSWLTYVRPIVNAIRESFPGKSWLWCYGKLLMGYQAPKSPARTSHRTARRLPAIQTVGDQQNNPPTEQTCRGSIELGTTTAVCSCQQTAAVFGDIRDDDSDLADVQSTSISDPVSAKFE